MNELAQVALLIRRTRALRAKAAQIVAARVQPRPQLEQVNFAPGRVEVNNTNLAMHAEQVGFSAQHFSPSMTVNPEIHVQVTPPIVNIPPLSQPVIVIDMTRIEKAIQEQTQVLLAAVGLMAQAMREIPPPQVRVEPSRAEVVVQKPAPVTYKVLIENGIKKFVPEV